MNPVSSFRFDPRRVTLALSAVAATLVVIHLIAMQIIFNDALPLAESLGLEYWHLSIFDLDEEENFGTWFSSGILFFSALLLWIRARDARQASEPGAMGWTVLALGFVFLSVDEVVALHELMNSVLDDTPWTAVAIPLVLALGAYFVPFLLRLERRTAILFAVAGMIYVGGAVGVEHFTDADVNSLHYNMWTALEEGMEMFGVILFIFALLEVQRGREIRLEVPAA